MCKIGLVGPSLLLLPSLSAEVATYFVRLPTAIILAVLALPACGGGTSGSDGSLDGLDGGLLAPDDASVDGFDGGASQCPSDAASGACTQAGLTCDYGFESYTVCIAPELQWHHCGGVTCTSSEISTGDLCCMGGGYQCQSSSGKWCSCEANHFDCH